MLKIPKDQEDLEFWVRETIDECMASAQERGMMYTQAAQYYYTGTFGQRAAIYNKIKPFIDRLAGFLMQPTDVRFAIVFDSGESESVLKRAQSVSDKLSADYRQSDSDITFAEATVHALVNGCYFIKHVPHDEGFKISPVHPQNFGVLGETILDLDEQEAFCHVSYPTISRLRTMLEEIDHPRRREIIERILEARPTERDEEEPTYFHSMVVGGLQPLSNVGDSPSSAAGVVQVFPVPTPWKPQRKLSPTVKFCELWIKDRERQGDYTTIQAVYGHQPIIIEGDDTRRNLSRIPGHHPFVKIQGSPTPGYFYGRSLIADVQMLQDVLSKRLRDLKIMWDRNVNAPQVFSGFTSVTEEEYFKIINEGGFLNDPNPNAKATKLVDPPPENYLEELDYLMKLFDEASGFTPIMGGQGEPGVRAGVHAQTLVRTSSPRLIDQAARIERQLAQSGYLSLRIMQASDPQIYTTDADAPPGQAIEFTLADLPENFQVNVDSHSASPAFAEDNRQVAIALARAGAIDAEDLIHLTHPPGADLLLSRLRQRQKQQAQAAQQEQTQEIIKAALGIPAAGGPRRTGRRRGQGGGQ
jgi:hypothetical protein